MNPLRFSSFGLAALTLVFGIAANDRVRAEAGWTAYGRIVELQATTQGRFVFRLDVSANPSGCKESPWFYRDYRGLGAEQVYHALLEALGKGLSVKVYVTGLCDLNGYSEISTVSLAP